MIVHTTPIDGAFVLEASAIQDERGSFSRLFCERELASVLHGRKIQQINQSLTHSRGAVRGLHYQRSPGAEMKMVRCLQGRVFDVAVDLRRFSATFLKWHAVELSPENHLAYVIPEGCAHGFQVLEQYSRLLYLHTAFYASDLEAAARFDDPMVGVNWPLPVTDISVRDLNHLLLANTFKGID